MRRRKKNRPFLLLGGVACALAAGAIALTLFLPKLSHVVRTSLLGQVILSVTVINPNVPPNIPAPPPASSSTGAGGISGGGGGNVSGGGSGVGGATGIGNTISQNTVSGQIVNTSQTAQKFAPSPVPAFWNSNPSAKSNPAATAGVSPQGAAPAKSSPPIPSTPKPAVPIPQTTAGSKDTIKTPTVTPIAPKTSAVQKAVQNAKVNVQSFLTHAESFWNSLFKSNQTPAVSQQAPGKNAAPVTAKPKAAPISAPTSPAKVETKATRPAPVSKTNTKLPDVSVKVDIPNNTLKHAAAAVLSWFNQLLQ